MRLCILTLDMNKKVATLIVLAGGKSERMGVPKHLLPTPQGRLIDHLHRKLSSQFAESLLVGRNLAATGGEWRMVEDIFPGHGVLVGIYSGLLSSNTDVNFILACDMPFVVPELVSHLISLCSPAVDAVVPIVRGYYEPLFAVYRKSSIPGIHRALERGNLKVSGIFDTLRVHTVEEQEILSFDPELTSFINLNTPDQISLLSQLW